MMHESASGSKKFMHERQGQYDHNKNIVSTFPRFLYERFYKTKVEISLKLIISLHRLILFYRKLMHKGI